MGRRTIRIGALAMAALSTPGLADAQAVAGQAPARSPPLAQSAPDDVSGVGPVARLSVATGTSLVRLEGAVGSVAVDNAAPLDGRMTFVRLRPASAAPGRLHLASLGSRMPLQGRITSAFGMRRHPIDGVNKLHAGVDLAAPYGTAIRSASSGLVTFVGWLGGYGMMVEIDHGGGATTRYAHLLRASVSARQAIREGETIGYVGTSGRSTGPHLHFEIRQGGRPINPLRN